MTIGTLIIDPRDILDPSDSIESVNLVDCSFYHEPNWLSTLAKKACENSNIAFFDLLPRQFFYCIASMLPYVGICYFLHNRFLWLAFHRDHPIESSL